VAGVFDSGLAEGFDVLRLNVYMHVNDQHITIMRHGEGFYLRSP